MNWTKIYISLIQRAKLREIDNSQYFEKHHIIPDFMFKNRKRKGPKGHLPGNPNDVENMVFLTHREHVLSHMILCKIYRNTRYEYPCLSSLLIMLGGGSKTSKLNINRSILRDNISKTKLYSSFREKARIAISEARTGKIVCKDAISGEIIGSIDRDHENIKSGKWVHHTKGKTLDSEHVLKIKNANIGLKNGNSKGYTDDELIESYIQCCKDFGFIVTPQIWIKYSQKYDIPYIQHSRKFRFNGQGLVGLRKIAEKRLSLKYIEKMYLRKDTKENYHKQLKKWL
jgi:hypothetical protein